MAYAATIISAAQQGQNVEVTVDFSQAASPTLRDTFKTTLPTAAWLHAAVRERLAQLNGLAVFVASVPIGPFVPNSNAPTQFETDKATWLTNLGRLRVALIVFAANNPIVTNLQTTMANTYQNGFLD